MKYQCRENKTETSTKGRITRFVLHPIFIVILVLLFIFYILFCGVMRLVNPEIYVKKSLTEEEIMVISEFVDINLKDAIIDSFSYHPHFQDSSINLKVSNIYPEDLGSVYDKMYESNNYKSTNKYENTYNNPERNMHIRYEYDGKLHTINIKIYSYNEKIRNIIEGKSSFPRHFRGLRYLLPYNWVRENVYVID